MQNHFTLRPTTKKKADELKRIYNVDIIGKSNKLMIFLCGKCGHRFKASMVTVWNRHELHDFVCCHCGKGGELASANTTIETAERIARLSKAEKIDLVRTKSQNYRVRCRKCGRRWKDRLIDLWRKHKKGMPLCPNCKRLDRLHKIKLSISLEHFALKLMENKLTCDRLGYFQCAGKYQVPVRCLVCGKEFWLLPIAESYSCPHCEANQHERHIKR